MVSLRIFVLMFFFFVEWKGMLCERNEIIFMDKVSKEVSKKDMLYVVSGECIFLNNKNLCLLLKIKLEWNYVYFYFYLN